MQGLAKTGQVQFRTEDISEAEENQALYETFATANQDDKRLCDSINEKGILAPLHISKDQILLDGHRRLEAARACGRKTVPVIIEEEVCFGDLEEDERLKVLRSFNYQRDKTFAERTAESLADLDKTEVMEDVREFRAEWRAIDGTRNVEMGVPRKRAGITTTKFLDAVIKVVNESKAEWPISNRAIHYMLLNDPPLTHDAKPDSQYRNELKYSKKLSSLLTRARIAGHIPMHAICDDERPTTEWSKDADASEFGAREYAMFLSGYQRDLMQSQPHHIEILVEKKTKYAAATQVAENYGIPVTAGKGFASLPPRFEMAERYRQSGKDKLIIIFLTDFDPDGEQIASSFARSLRDDFGVDKVLPFKAALTGLQVAEHSLPSSLEAKPSSPNYKAFVAEHGTRAVELDAMPSDILKTVLQQAIDTAIDTDSFNFEVQQEEMEQVQLAAKRNAIAKVLGAI